MINMPVSVYILKLSDSRFYTGITNNIDKRLMEHNSGKSKFTSRFIPCKIVFSQQYPDRRIARAMEVHIKNRGAKRFLQQKGFVFQFNEIIKIF